MKKFYYRVLRDFTAARLLASLLANPERYKYIAEKVENCELTNDEATHKNVTKAIIMADEFVDSIKQRNTLDS